MGLLDKVKNLTRGRKSQIKQGIHKGADVIDDKLPQHRDKIQKGAQAAQKAVDKLPD